MTPEDWLAHRHFSGAAFDPERLAAARRATGTRVSVVLPARDVAGTVGEVVTAIRTHWMGPAGLVDELVVMDGSSTDATARIAAEAGAVVHREDTVLPHMGHASGKGEAMWKSLHVTTGDLVLWMDADIVDLDPAYVPGMLGPLLTVPQVGFVKAAYARRLGDGDGGGRVTEICARPLLNLLVPELVVLAQPLSGEQAGRRELLRSIPFLTGYAVEVGLLMDVLDTAGLGAIAQVQLSPRTHVNQSTAALGRMGYAITRAVLGRRCPGVLDGDDTYARAVPGASGTWTLDRARVPVVERPPMRGIGGA